MRDSPLMLQLQVGEEVPLEASVRYELNAAFTVWIVEKEEGDLFFHDPNDPGFLPVFIQHCENGSIILGPGPLPDPKYSLFFLAPRSVTLRKISFKDLVAELAKADSLKEAIIKEIEHFLCRLLSKLPIRETAVSKFLEFGKGIDLNPQEVAAPPKSSIPEEKERVAWVEIVKGSCDFLEASSYLKESGILYPMSQPQWMRSWEESRLICFSTGQVLEKAELWKGIDALYHEIFKTMVQHYVEELEKALLRLQKRKVDEQELIEETLLDLGSVLNKEISLLHYHDGDELFQACALIGKTLGITFKNTPIPAGSIDDRVNDLCLQSNVNFRRITLQKEWWKEAVQPILAFLGPESKPVALISKREGVYEIIEPQENRIRLLTPELATQLEPSGYTFYTGFPKGKLSFFQVAQKTFQSNLRNFLWLLFQAAAIGSLNLFLPFATKELFDVVLFGTDVSLFKQFVFGLLIVSFSTTIYTLCKNFTVLRIEGISKSQMQTALWLRVLQLPLSFFRKFSSGDLATRIMAFEKVRMETSNVINLCVTTIFCLYYFALLFFYNPLFAALGLIGLFLAAGIFTICILLEIKLTKRSFALGTTIQGIVVQIISGIAKIRVAGAEGRFFNLWGTLFSQKKKVDLKILLVTTCERFVFRILPLLMTSLLFWLAIATFKDDPKIAFSSQPQQSLGTFVGFYTAYILLLASALEVFQMAFSLWSTLPYWNHSKILIQEETEAPEEKTQQIKLKGSVALERVTFRYMEGGPLALDDVSIYAEPGEMIGIVGPSGCGKSTIVRLLLGFERPEQGKVAYDNCDISDCDIRMIRKQIGTVLQNEQMLAGSIYNIISGAKTLPSEAVLKAISLAGLEEEFNALPMGLNTIMSMGGNTVSGGQRQRLFLARAMAASPKILILDEATSALDNKAQDEIDKNFEQLKITRIVIAHRLITTRHADRIYVMDEGKIVQVGTYEELSSREGLFSDMLKRQQL